MALGITLAAIISSIGITMAKELHDNKVGAVIKGQVCNPVTNTFINMDTINLAIEPYPIELVEGNKISIHFEVEVLKEIAKFAIFDVKLEKAGEMLPCVHFGNLPLGSCDYDFEGMIAFLCEVFKVDCDKNLPGYGCRFPLSPGHYGGDFVLPLPRKIPDIIKQVLDGNLKIHLSLKADGSEIACIDTGLEVSRSYSIDKFISHTFLKLNNSLYLSGYIVSGVKIP